MRSGPLPAPTGYLPEKSSKCRKTVSPRTQPALGSLSLRPLVSIFEMDPHFLSTPFLQEVGGVFFTATKNQRHEVADPGTGEWIPHLIFTGEIRRLPNLYCICPDCRQVRPESPCWPWRNVALNYYVHVPEQKCRKKVWPGAGPIPTFAPIWVGAPSNTPGTSCAAKQVPNGYIMQTRPFRRRFLSRISKSTTHGRNMPPIIRTRARAKVSEKGPRMASSGLASHSRPKHREKHPPM